MANDEAGMLRGFWYIAISARGLPIGKTLATSLLGEEMLIGRDEKGGVFAYADRCPHRGMPMRHGTFDGRNLRCCYHGWAFSAENGACTEIPALAEQDPTPPGRFRLRSFPCQEVQGNIWVFIPQGAQFRRRSPPFPGFQVSKPAPRKSPPQCDFLRTPISQPMDFATRLTPPSSIHLAGGSQKRGSSCDPNRRISSRSSTDFA